MSRINEELREQAIAEYSGIREQDEKSSNERTIKLMSKILIFIFSIMLGIPVFALAFLGRYMDSETRLVFIMVFATSLLTLGIFIAVFVFVLRAGIDTKTLRTELLKTTYHIADGYLIREYEGDRRKTKKYDLSKIYYPEKDGNVISFEYKDETVEVLDFYEPPLFDELCEATGQVTKYVIDSRDEQTEEYEIEIEK